MDVFCGDLGARWSENVPAEQIHIRKEHERIGFETTHYEGGKTVIVAEAVRVGKLRIQFPAVETVSFSFTMGRTRSRAISPWCDRKIGIATQFVKFLREGPGRFYPRLKKPLIGIHQGGSGQPPHACIVPCRRRERWRPSQLASQTHGT